jgi:hypothetical protein
MNMTTLPEMRDLAQRLLACEANASKTSESAELIILRVYEKLRKSLGEFAGSAAFRSLASRALAMARSEIPSLQAVQVAEDGALKGLGYGLGHGLSEFGPQIHFEEDRLASSGLAMMELLSSPGYSDCSLSSSANLLHLSLLRNAWPGEAFDDRNSVHGRKA